MFQKYGYKIKIPSKSDKNNGCLKRRRKYIYGNISPNSPYNDKCFRQKLYRKSKHIFYVQQLFSENRAVYEIMWKNLVEPDSPLLYNKPQITCVISSLFSSNTVFSSTACTHITATDTRHCRTCAV
jgi:hypothetical protein